jgi:hypothetical protein
VLLLKAIGLLLDEIVLLLEVIKLFLEASILLNIWVLWLGSVYPLEL